MTEAIKKKENKRLSESTFVYYASAYAFKFLIGTALRCHCKKSPEVRKLIHSKESFIVLSQHPSEIDAAPLVCPLLPRKIKVVAGEKQLNRGALGKYCQLMGVIPKKQFRADMRCIAEMMRAVKEGKVLAFMPEGRVSIDGTESPFEKSTAGLLKKMGVPIVVVKIHGSYFVKPSYAKGMHFGKVSSEMEILYTKEEVKALSAEEIAEGITEALTYDQDEYNNGKHIYGLTKNRTKGISSLFYICPDCGEYYTVSDHKDRITCSSCKTEYKVRPNMLFTGGSVNTTSEWNRYQIQREHEYWSENDSIEFNCTRNVCDIFGDTQSTDNGLMVLDREGFHYTPENGDKVFIPIDKMTGASSDYLEGKLSIYTASGIDDYILERNQDAARFINSLMVIREFK